MRSGMKMMAVNEMRRRRDSRGRYMEGGQGSQMEMGYGRMEGGQMNQGNYNRMEGGGGSERMESEMRGGRGGNRNEGGNSNRMEEGGASGHYWPMPIPPPYGGEEMEMRGGNGRREMNIRPGRERREEQSMMDPDSRMNDNNVINISEYQDRRKIGFGANRMHYGEEGRMKGEKHMHGGAENQQGEYPMMEQLTEEVATAWVSKLKNTDPEHPVGPKWSRETLKPLAMKHGFTTPEKQLEFWAVMNMMYSDYAETAKKNGVSNMDFFADMAKAWMKDKDAVEHKTAAYIMCCTE